MSYGSDTMLAEQKLAVPGSVADAYLREQADATTADLDAGISRLRGFLRED